MIEISFDKASQSAIADIREALETYPVTARKAIETSLKVEGFRLRDQMKQAIDKGGVPGRKWPGINMAARRMTQANRSGRIKNYRRVFRGKKGKKWPGREYWSVRPPPTPRHAKNTAFAKFKGGLRYEYDEDKQKMEVGFVNPSTPFQQILERHAGGFSTPISDKARRFAFAMGVPISAHKRFFHIPARPLVFPIWEREQSQSLRNIEQKFFEVIDRNVQAGTAK